MYILLPTRPNSAVDRGNAPADGTAADDGWALASGTSSATPQVAGVCALLKQQYGGMLDGRDARAILHETGVQVTQGSSYDNVAADGDWSRLVNAEAAVFSDAWRARIPAEL